MLDDQLQRSICPSRAPYLVYLSPFFGRLVCEPLVDHGHDFVELLAGFGESLLV